MVVVERLVCLMRDLRIKMNAMIKEQGGGVIFEAIARLPLKRRITAYELMGALDATDIQHYCCNLAYLHFHQAMMLRTYSQPEFIPKEVNREIEEFYNWRECRTLEDLQAIQGNEHAIRMESLVISERLLINDPLELTYILFNRGSMLLAEDEFHSCLFVWKRGLEICKKMSTFVSSDLRRFVKLLCVMRCKNLAVNLEDLIPALEMAELQVERSECVTNFTKNQDTITERDYNLRTALFLIAYIAKSLEYPGALYNLGALTQVKQLISDVINLKVSNRHGQSLLHMALDSGTVGEVFRSPMKDIFQFPCMHTAKLVIKLGADPNALDILNNSALHTFLMNENLELCDEELFSSINFLKDAGTHLDIVNHEGNTAYDIASDEAKEIIKSLTKMSLQCLSARVLGQYKFFSIEIPPHLQEIIRIHTLVPKEANEFGDHVEDDLE